MSNNDRIHDKSLDALLDGSLSSQEAKRLIALLDSRESHDKNLFMGLGLEKVPEKLCKRLCTIPRQTSREKPLFQYRVALALISIAIVAVLLVLPRRTSDTPTPVEIDQARKELAIAFDYLQKAGRKTDAYVKQEVGYTVQDAIFTGVVRGIN
jgi:hypothetical protein